MSSTPAETSPTGRIADQVLAALDAGRSIPPLTEAAPDLDLDAAYRVAAMLAARREARGERIVGWKIGFTNRTIWDVYGVHAPIWGPMYAGTVAEFADGTGTCPLAGLVEPRIEPEIAFRLARIPDPSMDESALWACIDGVAHGVEIVQSLYPGWRFRAPDTVAMGALHGRYRHGPFAPPADPRRLADCIVVLVRDGVPVAEGSGANVLDGPLSALAHFVRGLASQPFARGLAPGDIVTTGTLTDAFPVRTGETWTTRFAGAPLPGLSVRFT